MGRMKSSSRHEHAGGVAAPHNSQVALDVREICAYFDCNAQALSVFLDSDLLYQLLGSMDVFWGFAPL
jgi:hypothetical protein